jgi:predicted anti-sigma-YlaC factor YlaD
VLKCREVTELATDYMEQALPPRAWLAMRLHLALCSMCRTYLDQLRKTKRLLGRLVPPPAPPEVETQLVAAARTPHSQDPPA